jgi:nitroreductase
MIKELVYKNRSYRRFYEEHFISKETLKEFVDLARCSPSAANLQPLRYKIVNTPEECAKVFSTLGWAGYLQDWPGPLEGERPSSYILLLSDKPDNKYTLCDAGIACQSILLGAAEKGLGGCMFGSVKRDLLKELINIPNELETLLVVALGKPKETVTIDEVKDDNIKYWRDENSVHHVPKRSIEDILI